MIVNTLFRTNVQSTSRLQDLQVMSTSGNRFPIKKSLKKGSYYSQKLSLSSFIRWIPSKASKDGTDSDIAKYDGKELKIYMVTMVTSLRSVVLRESDTCWCIRRRHWTSHEGQVM